MLADQAIQELANYGLISPFTAARLNPASYDLTLDAEYRKPNRNFHSLDCEEIQQGHTTLWHAEDKIVMRPGDFILASTQEIVSLPEYLSARVEGKSSIGRIGLAVHITAGFIDPGFEGTITLEVANLAPWEIILRPGQRIAQIAFTRMDGDVRKAYDRTGHYNQQSGPTESKFSMARDKELA